LIPLQESSPKAVLICGLGRLGQNCAVLLKELGIPVFALHDVEPTTWDTEDLLQKLDRFTIGDCRRPSALEKAGVASCRAVLLTTEDERVNVSAALAARRLNPDVRLIIRSSQTNLNRLLNQRLSNLVALDIAELPATAFSLAAIGDETVGLFPLDGQLLRVVENRITPDHPWHDGFKLRDLNTRGRRVLHHYRAANPQSIDFHGWDPEDKLGPGDSVVYLEFNLRGPAKPSTAADTKQAWSLPPLNWTALRERIARVWAGVSQTQRMMALVGAALILIHVTGVILYRVRYPEVSLLDAFNVATVLIFDGYSNMFAQLKLPFPIPLWLLLFSLGMTMSGAVVTGILYAYITARVLSARLQFRRRPGRVPRANHTVVIGLGPLGLRVAEMLKSLNRTVVGVGEGEIDSGLLPGIPVIMGDPRQSLQRVNCETAASVMVLTDDDVGNLELALMASQLNRNCNLVIRSDDADFACNVKSLAPHMKALSVYALSAEAFAAAALGEKVLSLLRIGSQTVLATEYTVEAGDTLEGRLIVEATCGYGLVAILYQCSPSEQPAFFPSDDLRLEVGSRLVVLATMEGLQNVEHGIMNPRTIQVRILKAVSQAEAFEGARTLARVTGCKLNAAREMMNNLPGTLPLGLFRTQAERLVHELRLAGLDAEVVWES
jgi:Trk K+ transport system NAD-binding subunit